MSRYHFPKVSIKKADGDPDRSNPTFHGYDVYINDQRIPHLRQLNVSMGIGEPNLVSFEIVAGAVEIEDLEGLIDAQDQSRLALREWKEQQESM